MSIAVSADTIPKSVDQAMDKDAPTSNGQLEPGISIRNGPVEPMDVDAPATNGAMNGKRKSRASVNGTCYKEASGSSDDDDKPLVRPPPPPLMFLR